ncbi:MAG: galactose mutarotase [Rubrobacteraceae bacterium]|nr:galactose mutarotase [Rubrobacteraceae bacterium]
MESGSGSGPSGMSRGEFLKAGSVGLAGAAFLAAGTPAEAARKGSAAPRHGGGHHHGGSLGVSRELWGSAHGEDVYLYTLTSGRRMTVRISNYGGVVQSIWVPDRAGRVENVALGFPKLEDYVNDFENQPWPAEGGSGDTYFGAIIGQYANRIANGEFTLDGKTYHLPQNDGSNTLHGGPDSWNTKVWDASTGKGKDYVELALSHTFPPDFNGFPGQIRATVTYRLTRENALYINYEAKNISETDTVINLTNHTYFNLAGEGSGDVYDQLLRINADRYTPIDENLIPTGELAPVASTPFDFRRMKPIGRDIRDGDPQITIAHGFDHNFVLNGSGMRLIAVAEDPRSGRVLLTYTDQPGVQFYTGNFLVGDLVGTGGRTYRQTDGFTLETQHFPDSPNQPGFPSTVLRAGDTFTSTTVYRFETAGRGLSHHR